MLTEYNVIFDNIRGDLIPGARSGFIGTAAFFIDGERYTESWDLTSVCI